jgi:NADPH:quinone reductase-like Zn-dependent oxidoreductase
MKAIVFTEYGSPDLLQIKEVTRPTPKDDEALIKVCSSSINSWDWEFQSGTSFINRLLFGLFKPRPSKQILGADINIMMKAIVQDKYGSSPDDVLQLREIDPPVVGGDAVFDETLRGHPWTNGGGRRSVVRLPI